MSTATLLLVEDDDGIATPLARALGREGYAITRVATGADASAHIEHRGPDLVILDLGLPDIDGLEVCRRARDGGYRGPIIILTARGDELDRVVGLDTGADDYLSKPFGLAELAARVRSQLRRTAAHAEPTGFGAANGSAPVSASGSDEGPADGADRTIGDVRIDEAARRVWVGDGEVTLTAKEFGVLALLAAEPGTVVTRERFMDEVWDEHWFGSTKTLDVTLGRLRHKLSAVAARVEIVAVRGVGFRIEAVDA